MAKNPVPYEFVLEELDRVQPQLKHMFGSYGVYVGDKIMLILYTHAKSPPDHGIWICTTGEHHASLCADFPNMRSLHLFGPGETSWQVLPADADDFEESALKLCDFILKGDLRIGKVPKTRLKNSRKKAAKKASKKKKRR